MYARVYPLVVLLGAIVILSGNSPASVWGDDGIQVRLEPDKKEITVGDLVSMTFEVTHPSDYIAILPTLPQSWGDFEVRSQSPINTTDGNDDNEITSQIIVVTLFSPGTFETPELAVTVRDPFGEVFEYPVPAISLTVVPVLIGDDVQLRDLKPQESLSAPILWSWVAGGILLVGTVAAGVYLCLRRRKNLAAPVPKLVPDTRPPYQVALDELSRIASLNLPGEGRFKEHYTLVSDCIRRYLEQSHGVPSLDRTTVEIRSALRHAAIIPSHSRQIVALLSDCDLIKFTKLSPVAEMARQCVHQARELVDLTGDGPPLQRGTRT